MITPAVDRRLAREIWASRLDVHRAARGGGGPNRTQRGRGPPRAGLYTRGPITVRFEHDADCRKATYWARWVSRRGEFGPWSLPVSMSIAA